MTAWTATDIEKLRKLAIAGKSQVYAAEVLGRSAGSVSGTCFRNGIKFHAKRVELASHTPDDVLRKRWEAMLPLLKENLRRDLAEQHLA